LSENLRLFATSPPNAALNAIDENRSHYFHTSHLLSARTTLEIRGVAQVRFISQKEAESLAEAAGKRNVFARHSYENSFYIQRIRALSNETVIQVTREGDPDDMIAEAERTAEIFERIAVLSSTLALSREKLHRLLSITTHRAAELDITIGRRFYYLRSKSKRQPIPQGISIDRRFCKRFQTCGFRRLVILCMNRTDMGSRVERALAWLLESRQEPRIAPAVVKTSIALESLLIISESEPLAQSLSERVAFLLTSDPEKRRQVSRIIKRFYDVRSGIVHGGQKKTSGLMPSLLESVDRLALLLCLILAANQDKWTSPQSLREWCEAERWGNPSKLEIPFPRPYLSNAVALGSRNSP